MIRVIPSFPNYGCNEKGNVYNLRTKRKLKPCVNPKGYLAVSLFKDGSQHTKTVHILVAEAFHGLRPEGMDIRHLDGVRTNNHKDNLKYGTKQENLFDALKHGTHNTQKLTEEDVRKIRYFYTSLSLRSLAKIYGVSHSAINHIRMGRYWKHLVR